MSFLFMVLFIFSVIYYETQSKKKDLILQKVTQESLETIAMILDNPNKGEQLKKVYVESIKGLRK